MAPSEALTAAQAPAAAGVLSPRLHWWHSHPGAAPPPCLFASSSADGTVRLWSAATWHCLRVVCSHASPHLPVTACALTPLHTAAATPDGVIRLFATDDIYLAAVSAATSEALAAAESAGAAGGASEDVGVSAGNAAKRQRVDMGGSPTYSSSTAAGASPAATAAGDVNKLERELVMALRSFIRIRTVSSDPSLHEECFRGAKFVLRLLERLGAEVKLVQPVEDKNPVVLARLGQDPAKPTITFYGHYDVQPAGEPEWTTDPWWALAGGGGGGV
jgi:di- and tripeptidase